MAPRCLRRGVVVAVAVLCLLVPGAAAVNGNLSATPTVDANETGAEFAPNASSTDPNVSAATNATPSNATVNETSDQLRVQRPNATGAGNTSTPAGNATSTRVSEDDPEPPSPQNGASPPTHTGDLPSEDDLDPDPGTVNPGDPTPPNGEPPSSPSQGPSSSPGPVGPPGPAPDAGPEAPPAPSSPEPGSTDPDPPPGASGPSEDPACQDGPRLYANMAVSPDTPEPPQMAAAAADDGGSQDCEDVDDPIEDPLGDILLSGTSSDGEDAVVDPLVFPSGGGPGSVAPPDDEPTDGEETSPTDETRSASVSGAPPEGTSSQASDDALEQVTVAAAILALLVPIVLLYRRLTDDDVLGHERRRNVMEIVREAPGSTTADVARHLDVDYRTARHHLEVLEEFDHVERERREGRIRYFENHQRYGGVAKALAAALDAETRRSMLRELLREGSLTSGELADRADVSASTASHHLRRLQDADLVEGRREGRSTRYELARSAKASLMDLVRGPADA